MGITIGKGCVGCRVCESVCPYSAIEVIEGLAVVNGHCTLCSSCAEACLYEAIAIERPGGKSAEASSAGDWSGVWVIVEPHGETITPVSYELLAEGRKLADVLNVELAAVVLSDAVIDERMLIERGADIVYRVTRPEFAGLAVEPSAKVLEHLITTYQPEIVLAGATSFGRTVMPKLAAALETGLTADCTGLQIDTEERLLLQTRPTFGGNLMATIVCPRKRPQMATVRPHVFKLEEPDSARLGEVIDVTYDGELTSRIRVIEHVTELKADERLDDAEIIVSGGRGLKDKDGFERVHELARLLGGAVGASRAVVDEGWISSAHQVGQTGKTVCPKLYIACGISGAMQHLAGMQTSEVIVAINKDPEAPIFEVADFGLVGDAAEIIPRLVKRLEEERGQ